MHASPQSVKNSKRNMAAECGGLYVMFLAPPSPKFLDLLLNVDFVPFVIPIEFFLNYLDLRGLAGANAILAIPGTCQVYSHSLACKDDCCIRILSLFLCVLINIH